VIELATVVRDLRAELETAVEAGQGEQLRFEVGQIDLETTAVIERSTDLGGKVRFWVIELGAERNTDNSSTLRISLSLTPKLASTGRHPMIDGQADPGED
jgi:hypothetical protein